MLPGTGVLPCGFGGSGSIEKNRGKVKGFLRWEVRVRYIKIRDAEWGKRFGFLP